MAEMKPGDLLWWNTGDTDYPAQFVRRASKASAVCLLECSPRFWDERCLLIAHLRPRDQLLEHEPEPTDAR